MKAKQTWKFSAPLEEVDVPRILRESCNARLVRFTIGGKVYVAVNREHPHWGRWADYSRPDPIIDWEDETPHYLDETNSSHCVYREDDYADGEILIRCFGTERPCKWGLSRDPTTVSKFLDLVETTVEVF